MANVTIANNGQGEKPEIAEDAENGIKAQPATKSDPLHKWTDPLGNEYVLSPGVSAGLAPTPGNWKLEVIDDAK